MFKNCSYNSIRSEIHLFDQVKGKNDYTRIPWVPYVFLPTNKSDIFAIDGTPVVKREFKNYDDYKDFLKKNKNNNKIYENEVRPETQFLSEHYYGIPDEEIEIPKLRIYYLDIEVLPTDDGFPKPMEAKSPVVLASIKDSIDKKVFTFAYDYYKLRKYEGNKNIKYINCDNEYELLRRLCYFIHKRPCDIMSGYNIWDFDLPYIINRCKNIFGEEEGTKLYKKISPINHVSVWKHSIKNKINMDISGTTILDYYNVYKDYGDNLPKYTLEHVCQHVLKKGKKKHPYKDLTELCKKDWSLFVDYNVEDCDRVDELEDILGYLRLIQSLSLLSKTQMRYYNSMTQLIDGATLTYFRRNNMCAPHFYGGEKKPFRAAWVKEPQVGLHDWVVDVDITSSYPSHIITLNMSIETFFGRIKGMTEDQVVSYSFNRKFPKFEMIKFDKGQWLNIKYNGEKLDKFNKALEKGLLSVAPNGSIFKTKKEGLVPKIERAFFSKRQKAKKKSKELTLKTDKIKDLQKKEKIKNRAKEFWNFQLAIKIFLNAFFGIMSVPYSRYFNTNIAEAITYCGLNTIKKGENFCNELLNNPNEKLNKILKKMGATTKPEIFQDYVYYIDTDSLFVGIGKFMKDYGVKKWEKFDDNQKIKTIKIVSAVIEEYIDDRIYKEVQIGDYNSQVHDFKIGFKQEIIAQTALFVKKKKYTYWLRDKEGTPKDQLEVTGLELIRSDSAEAVVPRLEKVLEMIMKKKDDKEIANTIKKYKEELRGLKPEDLAANIGINKLEKYLGGSLESFLYSSKRVRPKKGTPHQVKGVYNYRFLLERFGIKNKYEDIGEGLKAKVVYVKSNPFNVDSITFQEWPEEFNKKLQLDKEKMIEKFFIKKIRFLLSPIGKEYILDYEEDKLNSFF